MDTPNPNPNPNPAPDPAAAAKPAVPGQPDVSKPPAPAATAPPKPGDSPKPVVDAGDPADQRVSDAQRAMHRATEDAAQKGRDAEGLKAENAELRARLSGLVTRPEFHPVEEPPMPGDLSEDVVKAVWADYSNAPDDAAAFAILLRKALALSKEHLTGTQQHERARSVNQQKIGRLMQAVHTQINEKLQEQAPDVDLQRFWKFAAPEAQAQTPAAMTNPLDRWEFQMRRGLELYREWWGPPATPAPAPDPQTNPRPATATMPAGSLRPQGAQTAAQPRTMAEQHAALQERILPGAARRAG